MNGHTLIGELLIVGGLFEVWYSYLVAPSGNLISFIALSIIGLELMLIGAYVLVLNLNPQKIQEFLRKLQGMARNK